MEQARCSAVASLEALRPMASRVCCVLAQPWLSSTTLGEVGFQSVLTVNRVGEEDARDEICKAHAVIVPTFGTDTTDVTLAMGKLTAIQGLPADVVVFIAPSQDCEVVPTEEADPEQVEAGSGHDSLKVDPWQASMDIGLALHKARVAVFSAGADDAVCLFSHEKLRPHRLLEIVQKTDFMVNKMSEILRSELNAAEKKFSAKLQASHNNFLMSLPSRVLENIPYKDNAIEEHHKEGHLIGIAAYELVNLLGSGSFGNVYQGKHPEHGICAVKFMPKKRSMKTATEVFSLDRELGILLNLMPHRNVVRAREVLHTLHSIYIIMDFAGTLNLHKFTKVTIEKTGEMALPRSTVHSFTRQQGAALWHLHSNLISHRDLKGDNWIVDDAGEVLRLGDFGLAVQLCGTGQRLRQCCGSLPFCAPEVWSSTDRGTAPTYLGYTALAADIWSLGVLRGLQSLEAHWAETSTNMEQRGVITAIGNMIRVSPEERWAMGRVVGSQGLALDEAAQVKPPRSAMRPAIAKVRAHRRCDTEPAERFVTAQVQ